MGIHVTAESNGHQSTEGADSCGAVRARGRRMCASLRRGRTNEKVSEQYYHARRGPSSASPAHDAANTLRHGMPLPLGIEMHFALGAAGVGAAMWKKNRGENGGGGYGDDFGGGGYGDDFGGFGGGGAVARVFLSCPAG